MSRYAKRKDTAMLKEIGFAVLAAMGINGCSMGAVSYTHLTLPTKA